MATPDRNKGSSGGAFAINLAPIGYRRSAQPTANHRGLFRFHFNC
jgi:hypothetical protein